VRLKRIRTEYEPQTDNEPLREFINELPLEEKVCSGIMLGGKQVERKFIFYNTSSGDMNEAVTYCSFSQWFTKREEGIEATVTIDGATVGIGKHGTRSPEKVLLAQKFSREFMKSNELKGAIASEFTASDEWVRQLSMKIIRLVEGEKMTTCEMQIIYEGEDHAN